MSGEPLLRWEWIVDHAEEVAAATAAHAGMTLIAVLVGFALAFAVALAVRGRPRLEGLAIGVSGILYTIPSLALFALLIPFTGLSLLTSEIALVSYTLLILVRAVLGGLAAVPSELLDVATGLGHTPWQRLLHVELPLALPVIVAGLRVATVTTIGLVTVSALIGQSNLGSLIVDVGIRRQFPTAILVGAALAVGLAALAELGLLGIERRLTPWAREGA